MLQDQGKLDEAVVQYQRALALKSDYVAAHNNLGNRLRLEADWTRRWCTSGVRWTLIRVMRRRITTSAMRYRILADGGGGDAISACAGPRSNYAQAYNNLGNALKEQGKYEEAEVQYRRALGLRPDQLEARMNLGTLLKMRGKLDEAVAQYQCALR